MTEANYRAEVRARVLDEARFVRLTLSGKVRGGIETRWQRISVRPVALKGGRHLQFVYFDGRQEITQNYRDDEAARELDTALAIPYSSVHVLTTAEDLRVQVTKKGKAIYHRGAPPDDIAPDLRHDRSKDLPLPDDRPDAYLQAAGIMNADGSVKPAMRDKFRQVNEFLKLLEHTGSLDDFDHVNIVDFGCGSAYLTLAAYHYLNDIRGIPARLDGVDVNADLIAKNSAHSESLGYGDACCFHTAPILDYVPGAPPDIVMALHACDTATDDALYQGIVHHAGVILAAPCCHHHLHAQLSGEIDPMRPLLRHGILKKRMGDLLTDSLRALILRICGYKTDVVEFVASEHTDRNLMIRAVRRDAMPDTAQFVQEYRDLTAYWQVTPYLATLLGERFAARLA